MKGSSKKDRSVLPPLRVFPVASDEQTNGPGLSLGIQNSPGLARRKPQAHLKNNILPSKPWNTRDMLANLPNINSERGEELDSCRVYQNASNSNSRPNSRPQSPAMGIRDTLELGSPRRQLSRRSRSNSLDSFSEELLGLSGGSLEYQNELCPDRQCVYSPKDGRVPPRPPSIDCSELVPCLNSEDETSDFDSRMGSCENSPPGKIMPPSPASNKTCKFGKAPPHERVLLAFRSCGDFEQRVPGSRLAESDISEKRRPLCHSENSHFSRIVSNDDGSLEY